ncbi:putative sulfatase PB10D8.02c [Diplonema papillatum]|nr:putative sulfatase PB10D8.02c [Diplonema papillatum]
MLPRGLVFTTWLCLSASALAARPNVMFLLADDLGWNDIERHGSPQISTPNINSICDEGIQLNRYYGQPVCSPTRSTILSGRHVIHSGVYFPFGQGTSLRLNVSWKLLPEYFTDNGYDAHMVGKWHLGQNTLNALPTGRGFQSYLGYWSGAEDYYSHITTGGYDFQDGTDTDESYQGTYSTYAFADRTIGLLKEKYANTTAHNPFFFYVAFQNVHWPLEAPQEFMNKCSHVPDPKRQSVCAMATILDEAIGNITSTLEEIGELENTLVIFSSDNGGPTNNHENTMSNNYPLRGGKDTLWEGGTRLAACMMGPSIAKKQVWNGLMHTTDWLPTLIDAIGGEPPAAPQPGDGMSVWSSVSTLNQTSPRSWLLYETHPNNFSDPVQHGHAFMEDDMKIVWTGATNPADEDGWFPPPGQDPSTVNYTVSCAPPPSTASKCSTTWCLFNVSADPCEYNDIASEYPEIVSSLAQKLTVYKNTAVPPVTGQGCTPIVVNGAWRPCG